MEKSIVLNAGQNIVVKLYNLHALALKTDQKELSTWAYNAQSSLIALLNKVPRENPIKTLIPNPNTPPTHQEAEK